MIVRVVIDFHFVRKMSSHKIQRIFVLQNEYFREQ